MKFLVIRGGSWSMEWSGYGPVWRHRKAWMDFYGGLAQISLLVHLLIPLCDGIIVAYV